jgi:hypothetical protein
VPETDVAAEVRLLLERAETAPTTDEVAGALRWRFDRHTVLDALDYWRSQGQVLQDAEGRWEWTGRADS